MSADEQTPAVHRRRRRSASRPQGAPTDAPTRPAVAAAADAPASVDVDAARRNPAPQERPGRGRRGPHGGGRDGGLRDIVGAGPSKVGVSGALRARDVNRPTEDQLADAERDIVIVRRNWKPDSTH